MIDPINVTNPSHWLPELNRVTNGFLGSVLLIIIGIVVYVMLSHLSSNRAFAGSIFVTSVMCMLFYALGIVTLFHFSLSFVGIALAVVFLKAEKTY